MGRKDAVLKEFVQRNDVFADLCNVFIFEKKTILPAHLQEQDVSVNQSRTSMQRDVEKLCTVKDHPPVRMMIGIENQSYIDYSIPVRIGQYDSGGYGKQMRAHFRNRRKELKGKRVRNYPQELTRGCSLIPMHTLVLYWGEGEWDGPLSVRGMMDDCAQNLPAGFSDYQVHLVCMRKLTDAQMELIETEDLKNVLVFLQSADHPEIMKQKLADGYFQAMSDEAIDVISALTDTSIIKTVGGNNNMCYAFDVLKKEYAAEQVAIAKAETEARVRRETEVRVRRETVMNLITDSFERMKKNNPSLKDGEIICRLALAFGRSETTIRRWIRKRNSTCMQTR